MKKYFEKTASALVISALILMGGGVGSATTAFAVTEVPSKTESAPEITKVDATFISEKGKVTEGGNTFYTAGIFVQFTVENFASTTVEEIESVKVQILDSNGDTIVANVANEDISNLPCDSSESESVYKLIANGNSDNSISTKFGVPVHADSGCWRVSDENDTAYDGTAYKWQEGDIPSEIKVTIDTTSGPVVGTTTVTFTNFGDIIPGKIYRTLDESNVPQEFFTSIQGAIDDSETSNGDTIVLTEDLTTEQQITIDKEIILDGNGHTISPNFEKTDNSNNSAVGIQADDVTINDLIVDGSGGANLHGINVYTSDGVNINNVTTKNNDHFGLLVNGSDVTVTDITTQNNGWGGIDVDQGNGVNEAAKLTVKGTSNHSESLADIYVDDTEKDVSVVDSNSQYSFTAPTTPEDRPNDKVYTLKPATENTDGGGTGGSLSPIGDDESSDDDSSDDGGSSSNDNDDDDSDSNDSDDGEVLGASTMSDEEMGNLIDALSLATDGLVETFMNLSLEQQMLLADEMSTILAELAEILEGLQ